MQANQDFVGAVCLNVQLGDLAVVINGKNRKSAHAIFADSGPTYKLGEGAVALAETLDIPSSPRTGGASGDVIYIVFPGSGDGRSRSLEVINAEGRRLFEAWGGMAQFDACFPEYRR